MKSTFTKRSRKSFVEQWALEADLKRVRDMVKRTSAQIAGLKEKIETWIRMATDGKYIHPANVPDALKEKESEEMALAAYTKRRDSLQRRIDTLTKPSRAQLAKRTEQQMLLASLVKKRLAGDRLIDVVVMKLQGLLEARQELSAQMRAAALAIDLGLENDALDERRFDALFDSLPAEVALQSERWCRWFTGGKTRSADSFAYVVRREALIITGTLVSTGICEYGDEIELTQEEAGRVLAANQLGGSLGPAIELAQKSEKMIPGMGRIVVRSSAG